MVSDISEARPPLPPFDAATAAQKARMAENAWNLKIPQKVALAYTPNSTWRNRSEFIHGRGEIVDFLTAKWAREHEYRLIKQVWAYTKNQIAVRFAYEWHDADGQWYRSYGNENWQFDEQGLMAQRHASINDVPIDVEDRLFLWEGDIRPDDFPSLSELGI